MNAFVVALAPHRFHLQHGPIDCIVEIDGSPEDFAACEAMVRAFFPSVLPGLVAVKPVLYTNLSSCSEMPRVEDEIGQRMIEVCWPHRGQFITPMAAVAGAVADALLRQLRRAAPHARRLWVNNGGDIALWLAPGQSLRLGIVDDPQRLSLDGAVMIRAHEGIGGVATSGWRGRSFSFGIADAVTVLARDAATADAAATLIANAVNVDHPCIVRSPANTVRDETDLGERLVTTAVERLDASSVERALEAGVTAARHICTYGAICAVSLRLQNQARAVQTDSTIGSLSSEPPLNR